MPRRGGSGSRSRPNTRPMSTYAGPGSSSSLPAPTRPPSPPPPSSKQQQSGSGGGFFKQAAAVAGGVAAGNMLSAAVLGRGEHSRGEGGDRVIDPCAKELKNFIDCSRSVNDLSLCEGFNEALKACRKEYGPPPPPQQ